MPIEFRCTQCNKLLRTGDDTAGKRAKCPECGTVLTVPAAGTAPPPGAGGAGPAAVPPSLPPRPAGSPFGAGAAPPGGAENPYASPTAYGMAPGAAATAGAIAHTIIDFNDVLGRTWTIFKAEWGTCLVTLIVVWLISVAVNVAVGLTTGLIGAAAQNEGVAISISLLGNILTMLFSVWLGIGQALFFLKIARGQPAAIGDIFTGGPYFLPILGASILFGLICLGGYLLCVVPGVIFALMFSQFYYLMLDRNVGVTDSLTMSKDLMVGNKMTLFLVGLVAGVVGILIVIFTCGLGLLAVGPYLALLSPVIYLAITGQPTADQLRAPAAM